MSKLFRTKRRKVTAVIAVVALIAIGSAAAAWFITGTGTGAGKVGTLTALIVTQPAPGDVPAGVCVAGSSCDVYVRVDGASGLVTTKGTVGAITSSSTSTCPSANFLPGVGNGVALPLAEQKTLTSGTPVLQKLPGLVKLSANAPEACAGVGFTASVTVEAQTNGS